MALQSFMRGTTPTILFKVPMENPVQLYFTFSQDGMETLTIDKERMTYTPETEKWYFTLTQEETIKLNANKLVEIQVRALDESGIAIASKVVKTNVDKILKEGVI